MHPVSLSLSSLSGAANRPRPRALHLLAAPPLPVLVLCLSLSLSLSLSACSVLSPGAPKLKLGDVRVLAAPDANRNSAVVFELALVSDPALEQRLMNPAEKWFGAAADLAASYPQTLRVYHCEVTPGQELGLPQRLFEGQRAYAVFVFADLADGERRGRIEAWGEGGAINFARTGWSLTPRDKKAAAPQPPPPMRCDS
ncbi:hypothetical protein ACFOLJ_23665 [Rugamonas sp. CCM 8940]|uniref:hypothetical protein n=1 Tax=Rugamonas sp. CCM 8940 TaxID=2765359 RepID=UPI0018F4177F|nr:hypothetical protein [Rugamonas sp. CCM 8940]MBJ7311981.1 hypothetical protein [Rugamonas sp. CCM 8940]